MPENPDETNTDTGQCNRDLNPQLEIRLERRSIPIGHADVYSEFHVDYLWSSNIWKVFMSPGPQDQG